MAKVDVPQMVGLAGIMLTVFAGQLNDSVLDTALPDVGGAIGISMDAESWLRTLFVTGQVLGMCCSPSLGLGFSFRRFGIFVAALNCFPTLMMALGGGAAPLFILRFVQGVASGFSIPLLLTIALRALGPEIRLYGLATYALTATFTPNLATSLAALWIDGTGDWHWLFLQPIPFCAVAAVAIWWGLPQDSPQWHRLEQFDWPGLLLVATGFGSLSIIFEQGERLDWFNSELISVMAVVSAVSIAAFIVNEMHQPVPLVRLDLLKRRNFAYTVVALLVFLVIALSASQVPLNFLTQVRGYRPLQAHLLTLEVALPQLVLLPATAWLLDHRHVDARWVNAAGFACILFACFLGAHAVSSWTRDQFYVQQAFQAVGFAFVVMPLLMFATNSLKPEDGPFGSALFNTPRAVAEAAGFGVLSLITRWRGGLHRVRIADLIGQNRLLLGPLGQLPGDPSPTSRAAYGALDATVQQQVATLTTIDSFAILGLLVVVLLIVLAVLPERTYPPRIALAKG